MVTMRLTLGIVIALGLTGGVAAADDKLDQLFAEGRDLLENQKRPDLACAKFQEAIAIDPTAPGVMLNLGLCNERMGKYASSLYWFRKAQAASAEAKLEDYEEAAKMHTRDLAQKVAIAKIDVSTAPAGTAVSIDGRPLLATDFSRVEVDPGSVIEARARGKQPFRHTIEIAAGATDAGTIQIGLSELPAAKLVDPGAGRRRTAYILAAGGLALWGASAGYSYYVKNDYDDGQGCGAGADLGECYDTAKNKIAYVGTGMFVAGSAALAVGIVLYVTAPKPYRESELGAFAPIIGPDQVGLGYARSF